MKWQFLDEDYQRSYNPNLIYASLEIPTAKMKGGCAIAIKLGLSAIHL